jgi:PiT family inorganic phosphate transporter
VETATIGLGVVVFLVLVALAFDFMNGFHDAANSIATVVSTRVLKPYWAVIWAAFFNFVALFVFELKVASTIGTGIVEVAVVDEHVVFGALVGGITWNVITWYFGIPSSSSHALVGGIVGGAVAKAGSGALIAMGLVKPLIFMIASPLLGFVIGSVLLLVISWICARTTPARVDSWFRRLQLVSASLYSLGHGGNDAQKTVGIIWMLLIAAGLSRPDEHVPYWVVAACYVTIGLGTLFGGWRIVKTMGMKITKLKPVDGFCAETGGSVTLFTTAALGIPVSTTHTITGAIVGVGSVHKFSAVRWGVAGRIVWAWIFTLPCSALIAAAAWWLGGFLF